MLKNWAHEELCFSVYRKPGYIGLSLFIDIRSPWQQQINCSHNQSSAGFNPRAVFCPTTLRMRAVRGIFFMFTFVFLTLCLPRALRRCCCWAFSAFLQACSATSCFYVRLASPAFAVGCGWHYFKIQSLCAGFFFFLHWRPEKCIFKKNIPKYVWIRPKSPRFCRVVLMKANRQSILNQVQASCHREFEGALESPSPLPPC